VAELIQNLLNAQRVNPDRHVCRVNHEAENLNYVWAELTAHLQKCWVHGWWTRRSDRRLHLVAEIGARKNAMKSALESGSAWRSDGVLVVGKSMLGLSRTRLVVSNELFEQWQAAQLRAKGKEMIEGLKEEMEQERRRWNEVGEAEQAAIAI
jgi:hypothetical protein